MAKVKKMVEYKLWLNENGNKVIPPHIIDGGYYMKNDGRLIGILEVDDDVYISSNAFIEITEAQLTERITNLRANETVPPVEDRPTIAEEVATFMLKLN
jgi:hypothetical protein